MRRVPLVTTVIVAAAVAAMVALGLWQLLIRLPAKEAELARLAANPARPAVALPVHPDDALLFRRSGGECVAASPVRLAGAGAAGFRAIADCRFADRAAPLAVALGTTRDPAARIAWHGGRVDGYLSHAPDARPLIASLWDRRPRPLMLVADTPAPGLAPNRPPDLGSVPNNHLAYAVQWFFFAAVASIIYWLALRRRSRS